MTTITWPYLFALERLGLALALGLFVGMEREHRGKEAGLRTFAFATLLGAIGILIGREFAVLALALIGVLVILLSISNLQQTGRIELTTSAALIFAGFVGVLVGQGHTIAPTALAVVMAGLLAWKEELAGFTTHLTAVELRAAILLGVLALVVYPALPRGAMGPMDLFNPRATWATVILIAAIGFANYILLKLYGAKGMTIAGFLGGLVNSTVVVAELAQRHRKSGLGLRVQTYRGIVLALAAMSIRNGVLLGFLAPRALVATLPAYILMLLASLGLVTRHKHASSDGPVEINLSSPFSIQSVLKFGLLFLVLQVSGDLAQRFLGEGGFYGVSIIGGAVSSASAVASAGLLGASGSVSLQVAGMGALLASLATILSDLPIIARVANDRPLTNWMAGSVALIMACGIGGAVAGVMLLSTHLAGG